MKIYSQLIIAILLLMSSCSDKEKVDLIVTNGKVYTINEQFSLAESFAVSNGKIVAIGQSKNILEKYSSENILDAEGKYVYPGFNDAHCHFSGYGMNLLKFADLRGSNGPEEIYQILVNHHQKYGGEWILGRSWDQNDWEHKEFPDKSKLDELFPDNPVFLVRVDGHAAWCNSKAMEIAGISAGTKISGGEVLVKNGEPTGILIDNAEGLVSKHIPDPTKTQQQKALLAAQSDCFALGLTSVTDCGVGYETVLLMDSLQKNASLKMRINAMLRPSEENMEQFVKKGSYKTDRLNVNTIKLFADGALGSRGALLLEDYSDDPGNRGLQMEDQEYYDKICQLALDNNYIVATHCIGDAGNRLILDTYGKFLKEKNNRRWRIEHAQIIHPDDFEKFNKYSIVPSIQATHCTSDMYWAEDRIGRERIKGAYAYQSLLSQLGWLSNGTDFPVEEIDPLLTFYASVFRIDKKGWPEGGWQKEEALTREQALRSMTIWGAKASFEENEKGSLEPGKWADFILLDTDLMSATPEEVLSAKVVSTWISGEKVYEAGATISESTVKRSK